jgi:hypothetical protein
MNSSWISQVTTPVIVKSPFLGAFAKFRKATISFVMSVRTEQLASHWTDFCEIWYLIVFRKSVQTIQSFKNRTRITDTLHEDQCTILIISGSILLRIRVFSDKNCRENEIRHYRFNSLFSKIVPFMWKNIVQRGRSQMTIWRMHIACWLSKATNTRTHNM